MFGRWNFLEELLHFLR